MIIKQRSFTSRLFIQEISLKRIWRSLLKHGMFTSSRSDRISVLIRCEPIPRKRWPATTVRWWSTLASKSVIFLGVYDICDDGTNWIWWHIMLRFVSRIWISLYINLFYFTLHYLQRPPQREVSGSNGSAGQPTPRTVMQTLYHLSVTYYVSCGYLAWHFARISILSILFVSMAIRIYARNMILMMMTMFPDQGSYIEDDTGGLGCQGLTYCSEIVVMLRRDVSNAYDFLDVVVNIIFISARCQWKNMKKYI